MSHGQDQVSPAMQQAIRLISEGKAVEAEELLVRAVRDAETQFGRGTHEAAVANNDLGNLYGFFGDMKRASAAYRHACDGPMPKDTQGKRDRLTFLINLANALESLNELEEAERVHRQSVDGRHKFYGLDHPGYAFGLEPLAALLLRRGQHHEALEILDDAVNNFWRNGHERVATALAVRAEALKALGSPKPPFADLDRLPDRILSELANTVIQRRDKTDPVWARQVLADLLPLVESRFGPDHQNSLNVLATIANHEADMGENCDHDIRLSAIRRSLASVERQGKAEEALQAKQGLALALSAANRNDEALAAYEDTLAGARQLGDRGILSQVRRNFGLYLADLERAADAERELRASVDDAEAAEDLQRWGSAEATLGIFLMHQKRNDEAQPLLEHSLRRLDPSHPDGIHARHHLNALEAGETCHCGDSWEALVAQLRAYILKQLPKGLLEDLQLQLEGEDIKVGVQLAREATEEELQRLQILINQAIYTFKNRIGQRM